MADKETTQDTQQIYQRAGMDGRMGFGRKPAVLVVDLSIGFTSPESPLGGDLSAVLSANRRIIDRAREKLVPVIFTTVAFDESFSDAGVWMEKIPTLKVLVRGSKLVDIHPDLGRRADEPVIVKQGASAFFGTSLSARLTYLGVDTIILTGATTSGCVRATAIDCLQFNYRTIVPVECVGDRAQGPHEANLFDIGAKYADNVSVEVVLKYLDGL